MNRGSFAIQDAIGRGLSQSILSVSGRLTHTQLGQRAMKAIERFIEDGSKDDRIQAHTRHVHSVELREAIRLSLRTARLANNLSLLLISGGKFRKLFVRLQIIEFGSAAEGLLFDVVQSVGVRNLPSNVRPMSYKGKAINWSGGGLLETWTGADGQPWTHMITYKWLIDEARRLNIIDDDLSARLNWLRDARNIIHPKVGGPRRERYDIEESREALHVFLSTSQQCADFKKHHGL